MDNKAKESAVSEVVGVILVVALTVIMAAIIGAYVFGMMDSSGLSSHIVGITAKQVSPSLIEVTYQGGPDQKNLESLTIVWPSGTQQYVPFPKVGDVYQATNFVPPYNVTSGKDRVYVIGHFAMNASQVILDPMV